MLRLYIPLKSVGHLDCHASNSRLDAFLELGPQSHTSSSQELPIFKVDFEAAPQVPYPVLLGFRSEYPPRGADSPIHLSIPTTVLMI